MARPSTTRKKGKSVPKKKKLSLRGIDAVILAGGLGTRLRSVVADRPKVLAEVGGKPFLDIIVGDLKARGVSKIILSVGHLRNHIKKHYMGKKVFFAEEENPLGTGGGVKNAERFVTSENFLAMNGDSVIAGGVDFGALCSFHEDKKALLTIVLAKPRSEKDYGAAFVDSEGKIVRYNEKKGEKKGHLMNAGVYLMRKEIFASMPQEPFSLEEHFFPSLVGGEFYGFVVDKDVLDIGTPERYNSAKTYYS